MEANGTGGQGSCRAVAPSDDDDDDDDGEDRNILTGVLDPFFPVITFNCVNTSTFLSLLLHAVEVLFQRAGQCDMLPRKIFARLNH